MSTLIMISAHLSGVKFDAGVLPTCLFAVGVDISSYFLIKSILIIVGV